MKRAHGAVLALAIAACASRQPTPAPSTTSPPGLLVVNARLVDGAGDAILLRGTDVVAVGARADLAAQAPGARVVDAQGGLVLPGFHDAHVHLTSGGFAKTRVDLSEAKDLAQTLAAVKAYADENPDAPWIQGRGFAYGIGSNDGMPTRQDLDSVVPDRPVYLRAYDGHTAWVNTKALQVAGVGKDTKDPVDGKIDREQDGTPSGTLREGAMSLVGEKVPAPTRAQKKEALAAAVRHVVRLGVTSADHITYDVEEFAIARELEREGRLPLRLSISPLLWDDPAKDPDWALYEKLRAEATTPRVRFGFLKGFVDGVVESKTAAMLAPYEQSTEKGAPLIPPERLKALVAEAHRRGFQVALHSIGDAAVRLSLDAYEAAQKAHPDKKLRHRVEHIEVIDAADLPRFKALDVVASMQPFHANPGGDAPDDGPWSENLGAARRRMTFPWRMLLDAGAPLAYGSDWPVMSADPLRGVAVALTRRDEQGRPKDGWNAHQAVTAPEALRAYAVERGRADGPATEVGTIAAGQRADLVLLSPDVRLEAPATLWRGTVRAVVVDGAVAYEAD